MATFFDRLQARVDAIDSLLCVGLDPHVSDLVEPTAEGAYQFCKRLIDATAPYAAAYKPNAAFFEVFGAEGSTVLQRLISEVPDGIPVVLDSKRGDIATTAEAYAEASYKLYGADCVTLSGYMGSDSIQPFLADGSKGVFVLCKTSNPSSNDLQTLPVVAGGGVKGQALFEAVAELAAGAWGGPSRVGLVVGATDAHALARARSAAGGCWILAPGVGFQGGDLAAALGAGLRPDGSGMLLPVSRGISRAPDPAAAARDLAAAINAVRKEVVAAAAAAAAERGKAGGVGVLAALAPHQREFITLALELGVLRFGSFTLKSGRVSPYFFNAGAFRTGRALAMLGRTYAAAIASAGVPFAVLFGPAYKGIPLVTVAATALAGLGTDVPVAYNRKEAKDHGEGGAMVGADVAGQRVLIVDDVISAGTAIGESVGLLRAAGAIPAGVVIGLDRQERGGNADSPLSAVQQVTDTYGIPVVAVVTLTHLLAFLTEKAAAASSSSSAAAAAVAGLPDGMTIEQLLAKVKEYRDVYGVAA